MSRVYSRRLVEVDGFVEVEHHEAEVMEAGVFGGVGGGCEFVDETEAAVNFVGFGIAGGGEVEGALDLALQAIGVFRLDAAGEVACLFLEPVAIEHIEGLGGLDAGEADRGGAVGFGEVEAFQDG